MAVCSIIMQQHNCVPSSATVKCLLHFISVWNKGSFRTIRNGEDTNLIGRDILIIDRSRFNIN